MGKRQPYTDAECRTITMKGDTRSSACIPSHNERTNESHHEEATILSSALKNHSDYYCNCKSSQLQLHLSFYCPPLATPKPQHNHSRGHGLGHGHGQETRTEKHTARPCHAMPSHTMPCHVIHLSASLPPRRRFSRRFALL